MSHEERDCFHFLKYHNEGAPSEDGLADQVVE